MSDALAAGAFDGSRHCFLIDGVGAGRRDRNLPERQAENLSLRVEQSLAHGVHGDAGIRGVDRSQQGDDFDLAPLPRQVQRPGAVFSRAPGHPGLVGSRPHSEIK